MNKYKITAHLFNPFDDAYIDANVKSDYVFISDESNPYDMRVERIKKYPTMYGAVEEYNADMGDSFIDEDADGVYLLEKITK
jgi:hypothetical protein